MRTTENFHQQKLKILIIKKHKIIFFKTDDVPVLLPKHLKKEDF